MYNESDENGKGVSFDIHTALSHIESRCDDSATLFDAGADGLTWRATGYSGVPQRSSVSQLLRLDYTTSPAP